MAEVARLHSVDPETEPSGDEIRKWSPLARIGLVVSGIILSWMVVLGAGVLLILLA